MKTEFKGWGLFAGQFIPKGSFITQYVGEIYAIDSKYGKSKLREYKDKTCTYLMSISKSEVIDPTIKGNIARFINHSCDPNCETQKWHVLGEVCVGVFAIKDIEENEELTFNYGFDIFKTVFQKCYCNTTICKGYLGLVKPEDLNSPNVSIKCLGCNSQLKNSHLFTLCEICNRIYHKECIKSADKICKMCLKQGYKKSSNSSKNELEDFRLDESNLNLIEYDKLKPSDSQDNKDISLAKESDSVNKEFSCRLGVVAMRNTVKRIKPIMENPEKSEISDKLAITITKNIFDTMILSDQIKEEEGEVELECATNELIKESINMTKSSPDHPDEIEENHISIDKPDSKEEINHIGMEVESETVVNTRLIGDNKIIKLISPLKNQQQEMSADIEEEVIEIESCSLEIIKENLKYLNSNGVRLFWEREDIKKPKIELKISGTAIQIHNIKQAINDIILQDFESKETSALLKVPKLFLRKIVGYQGKYIDCYKMKYSVKIEYDIQAAGDEIYQLTEETAISVKGKRSKVELVIKDLKKITKDLKSLSIQLQSNEYVIIKSNISSLKTQLDPADIRLAKWDGKPVSPLNQNLQKELVAVGNIYELKKCETAIKEYILKQSLLKNSYHLAFFFNKSHEERIKDFMVNVLDKKSGVLIKSYSYPLYDEYLSITMEGKWSSIKDILSRLNAYLFPNTTNEHYKYEAQILLKKAEVLAKSINCFTLTQKTFMDKSNTFLEWDMITEDLQNSRGFIKKSESRVKYYDIEKKLDDSAKFLVKSTLSSALEYKLNYDELKKYLIIKNTVPNVPKVFKDMINSSIGEAQQETVVGSQKIVNSIDSQLIKQLSFPSISANVINPMPPFYQPPTYYNPIYSSKPMPIDKSINPSFMYAHPQMGQPVLNPMIYGLASNYNHRARVEQDQKMNISYNISNINQMNINISINQNQEVGEATYFQANPAQEFLNSKRAKSPLQDLKQDKETVTLPIVNPSSNNILLNLNLAEPNTSEIKGISSFKKPDIQKSDKLKNDKVNTKLDNIYKEFKEEINLKPPTSTELSSPASPAEKIKYSSNARRSSIKKRSLVRSPRYRRRSPSIDSIISRRRNIRRRSISRPRIVHERRPRSPSSSASYRKLCERRKRGNESKNSSSSRERRKLERERERSRDIAKLDKLKNKLDEKQIKIKP